MRLQIISLILPCLSGLVLGAPNLSSIFGGSRKRPPDPVLESLEVVPDLPEYGRLRISARGCSKVTDKVVVWLKSCNGVHDRRKEKTFCKEGGVLVCVPIAFQGETCLKVTAGNQTDTVELEPYQFFTHREEAYIIGTESWTYNEETEESSIRMGKEKGIYTYNLTVTPDTTAQVTGGQKTLDKTQEERRCQETREVVLEATNETNTMLFTADWKLLDRNCSYTAKLMHYDACGGRQRVTPVHFPDLQPPTPKLSRGK